MDNQTSFLFVVCCVVCFIGGTLLGVRLGEDSHIERAEKRAIHKEAATFDKDSKVVYNDKKVKFIITGEE